MKKLFCLLLAAILVFGFTACGGSQNADSADAGDAAEDFDAVRITRKGMDIASELIALFL